MPVLFRSPASRAAIHLFPSREADLQVVQLRVVAFAEDPSFPHRNRGLVLQGTVQEADHVLHRVDASADVLKGLGAQGLEAAVDLRQPGQRLAQADQVPRVGDAEADPAVQALQVLDFLQGVPEGGPFDLVRRQFVDRVQPSLNPGGLQERVLHPPPEKPGPHGRLGEIQNPEEAVLLRPIHPGLDDLEVPQGRVVEDHVILYLVPGDPVEMPGELFLRLLKVAEQGPGSTERLAAPVRDHLLDSLRPELLLEHGTGRIEGEMGGRPGVPQGGLPAPVDRLEGLLAVQVIRQEHLPGIDPEDFVLHR